MMMKKVGSFLLSVALVASGLYVTASRDAYAWTLYEASHFDSGFEAYEPDSWLMSSWSNGDMFNCTWTPDNISFVDGIMEMTIDSDGNGGYTGGEYRTQEAFGYGMYQVNMKPISNPGVVSSFFTYTGPSDGTIWDEIDIEFLGYDTTKVQFNYYTNGVGGHECLYDLGFDASKDFHTYGFYWGEGVITWYVDGQAVRTATANIPTTPGHIMMNVWPGIGVDNWLQPFNGKTPLTAYYDWMAYDAPRTDEEDTTQAESETEQESTAESSAEGTETTEASESQEESTEESEPESSEEAVIVEPYGEIHFADDVLYTIISKNSGKSLDVSYGNPDNGTNVLQYIYSDYDNQKWYIQKQANGYYIIKSYATGKVLSVEDFSTENGGNIHQWEYVGNANQEWSLVYTSGFYKLVNRNSGLLLDVSGISKEDNANVQQWEDMEQDNQLWRIAPLTEEKADFPFTDVKEMTWYYDTVKEIYELGLMTGFTETIFAPTETMTRAMVATVLYRMAGNPETTYEKKFTDVPAGKYYSIAVTWAAENGVVSGFGDGKFRPGTNVTREQMVKMLYNYAEMLGLDTSARADLTIYQDWAQISNYAKEPMSWAVAKGILSGTATGELKAKNDATRAEVAKMLLNFYKLIEE
ncbi:MAG: family 16 glycosylhydrolase [Lachnospiraceae bacterium]|nr:family 16 glycosylhydrolase [Lachnospiraceae bacterium]